MKNNNNMNPFIIRKLDPKAQTDKLKRCNLCYDLYDHQELVHVTKRMGSTIVSCPSCLFELYLTLNDSFQLSTMLDGSSDKIQSDVKYIIRSGLC